MSEQGDISLKVGESYSFHSGTIDTVWGVTYAGMPNDRHFSIAVGNTLHAYNLYFSKTQDKIKIKNVILELKKVTKENIIFQYLEKKEKNKWSFLYLKGFKIYYQATNYI